MKSISCSAVLACGLLALMLCAHASSAAPAGRAMGVRRRLLEDSAPQPQPAPAADDGQQRALKSGNPRHAGAELKGAQSGRIAGTMDTCYQVSRNDYCDYGEQQNCCKAAYSSSFSGCVESSNLYNCPWDRSVMVCCY